MVRERKEAEVVRSKEGASPLLIITSWEESGEEPVSHDQHMEYMGSIVTWKSLHTHEHVAAFPFFLIFIISIILIVCVID